MREKRSTTQILFGLLPQQTTDLAGRVWKVKEWRNPRRVLIDDTALRQELVRLATPWAVSNRDSEYARHLRQGRELQVLSLDRQQGVLVEPFPELWKCKRCDLVTSTFGSSCRGCGGALGQLPFVGYHECGSIYSPRLPSCPRHRKAKVKLPGTASAHEIVFTCPDCNAVLQKGLGFGKCRCGGQLKYNVHRAAPVYTPRTVVVVNPVSPERVRRLNDAGGPARALSWIVDDLRSARYDEVGLDAEAFLRDLVSKGIPERLAQSMVEQARSAGAVASARDDLALSPEKKQEASRGAVTIAMALDQSRMRVEDLVRGLADSGGQLGTIYRQRYITSFNRAGLQAIELVDRFPILTGNFAYTREKQGPGESSLVAFTAKSGAYVVHGELAQTEALFIRLQPILVARWLVSQGLTLDPWSDDRTARLAILRAATLPTAGATAPAQPTVGSALLTLVHSYSHRFVRRAAVFSGIDRNSLSELLVPEHLAFFIYATPRGDFVLGGLQAVFESELHNLLEDVITGDPRCPLDPGCSLAGSACMACLHLGEPSCRFFNQYLARSTLFGSRGYLRLAIEAAEGSERSS